MYWPVLIFSGTFCTSLRCMRQHDKTQSNQMKRTQVCSNSVLWSVSPEASIASLPLFLPREIVRIPKEGKMQATQKPMKFFEEFQPKEFWQSHNEVISNCAMRSCCSFSWYILAIWPDVFDFGLGGSFEDLRPLANHLWLWSIVQGLCHLSLHG